MQKVFKNCYELDENCYVNYGLSEDYLMHYASLGMANYIRSHFVPGSQILIVSGPGNNGADGVVLARELFGEYDISLFMPLGAISNMAKVQIERSLEVGVNVINSIEKVDIVVDALFGAGLNKKLDDSTNKLIEDLNSMSSFKIACDIPTGIGEEFSNDICFMADITITMGALKESLYEDNNLEYIGEVLKVDLGLESVKYELDTNTYLLEKPDMKLPTRSSKNVHKGSFGHSAVICGSKAGAGILTAMSSARFGSGLTTLVIQDNQESVPPYLMTSSDIPTNTTSIAIGMGLGEHFSKEFIQKEVIGNDIPLVVDADMFYRDEVLDLLSCTTKEIVLTPHPKEFAALWSRVTTTDVTIEDIQNNRFKIVKEFSQMFPNITLLLKGANMLIAYKGIIYINEFGTSKLSKGGSGDVLSGLIASLLAQGYSAIDAAISASLAFTLSAQNYEGASYSMLPTDIIDGIATIEHKY